MSGTRQLHNIALVGFMGTGKSSVGHLVADQLHFTFLDTDEMIETRSGKSISTIFAEDGEPAFRKLERDLVLELSVRTKTVLSTGGGLGANAANLSSLKEHSLVVCLWASRKKSGNASAARRIAPCSAKLTLWPKSANCLPHENQSTRRRIFC